MTTNRLFNNNKLWLSANISKRNPRANAFRTDESERYFLTDEYLAKLEEPVMV